MGISIDVDSIVTHEKRRDARGIVQWQWDRLQLICDAMGWDQAPWEEPSPIKGSIDTSCSYSRFVVLRAVAIARAKRMRFGGIEEHLKQSLKPEEYARFPHFLFRGISSNYYLPIDLENPIEIKESDGLEEVIIGSSLHMHRELLEVREATLLEINDYGEEALVEDSDESLGQARYNWGDILNLCEVLIAGSKESETLNLPLQLLW